MAEPKPPTSPADPGSGVSGGLIADVKREWQKVVYILILLLVLLALIFLKPGQGFTELSLKDYDTSQKMLKSGNDYNYTFIIKSKELERREYTYLFLHRDGNKTGSFSLSPGESISLPFSVLAGAPDGNINLLRDTSSNLEEKSLDLEHSTIDEVDWFFESDLNGLEDIYCVGKINRTMLNLSNYTELRFKFFTNYTEQPEYGRTRGKTYYLYMAAGDKEYNRKYRVNESFRVRFPDGTDNFEFTQQVKNGTWSEIVVPLPPRTDLYNHTNSQVTRLSFFVDGNDWADGSYTFLIDNITLSGPNVQSISVDSRTKDFSLWRSEKKSAITVLGKDEGNPFLSWVYTSDFGTRWVNEVFVRFDSIEMEQCDFDVEKVTYSEYSKTVVHTDYSIFIKDRVLYGNKRITESIYDLAWPNSLCLFLTGSSKGEQSSCLEYAVTE